MANKIKELKESIYEMDTQITDHIISMLNRKEEWDIEDELKFQFLLGQLSMLFTIYDKLVH